MNNRTILLIPITVLFFLLVYFFHPILKNLLKVDNKEFVDQFYIFISIVSLTMLINIYVINYFKPKLTSYTFLIWSMLKIILVMAFMIIYVLLPKLNINHSVVFDIIILYFVYLIYEVGFGIYLLIHK